RRPQVCQNLCRVGRRCPGFPVVFRLRSSPLGGKRKCRLSKSFRHGNSWVSGTCLFGEIESTPPRSCTKSSTFSVPSSANDTAPPWMPMLGRLAGGSPACKSKATLFREFRDSTFRAHCPAFAGCAEADTVVLLAVQRLPGGAVIQRNVGARRAHGDPT